MFLYWHTCQPGTYENAGESARSDSPCQRLSTIDSLSQGYTGHTRAETSKEGYPAARFWAGAEEH